MKVCFVAGTLGQGGAERQLFYMVQSLRNSGAAVRVLSFSQREFWEQRIRDLGVPVTWTGPNRSRWSRLRAMVRELRPDPPHILQGIHFHTNVYVALAARLLRSHEIGGIRSNLQSDLRLNGFWGGNLGLRFPRLIAANSMAAIRHAVASGISARRFHYLGNIVDTTIFRPGLAPRGGPVRLIVSGRLTSAKRMDRFLRVLSGLRQKGGSDIRATIAGAGPLEADLRSQAIELGLTPDVVEFRGGVSEPAELAELYCRADILTITSDYEGTPNAALEAMACGLPVVGTRVGGMEEIVQDGRNGFLVDRNDEPELIERLHLLARDRCLRARLGANGRQMVETQHSLPALPAALQKLYSIRMGLETAAIGQQLRKTG